MGKYGIGARVRDDDGDEGVIVGKRKGERQVEYDRYSSAGPFWFPKRIFTPLPANDDAPATQEREGEPEGRFKVGDRVKIIDNMTPAGMKKNLEVGSEHTIVRAARTQPDAWILSGDELHWWPADQLLSTPEWQPKVGDRVRVDYNSDWRGDGEVILTVLESCNVRMDDGRVGGFSFHHLMPLPVAAEAQGAVEAPLTIEAGKFYKTRDGRKVGPMEVTYRPDYTDRDGNRAAFHVDGMGHYAANGNWLERLGQEAGGDLVAEWVDSTPADTPVSAGITVGTTVILAAPARVTGINGPNVNLTLSTGGSFDLPLAALVSA